MNNISPSSSGFFPLPGSPGSSWPRYKARLKSLFQGADASVLIAFWLFGLINNVSYVIILSAALDLVGPSVPKSTVLLADVLPSFFTKLFAPYFIHRVPYSIRVLFMVLISATGMFLIALTPDYKSASSSVPLKLFGVCLASLSSGAGELSFLGLTHYYGPFSLAAWGSGTGGAGLIGAGLYVFLTTGLQLSVRTSLLSCAFLPFIMLIAFFMILPLGMLHSNHPNKDYMAVPHISLEDDDISGLTVDSASQSLLATGRGIAAEAYTAHAPQPSSMSPLTPKSSLLAKLRRARLLFFPYMVPLLLVYVAEYTINQGVTPTLLFPLSSTPFRAYRSFYPFYAFLYQLGVFISRSSTPFVRIHNLYIPSLLQCGNLALLVCQSLFNIFGDQIGVYIIFLVIFWEGLLGGAVYVNTFAEIMENVKEGEREFSLSATSVSDSAGICIAGFIGMFLEQALCGWQVERGRSWCRE